MMKSSALIAVAAFVAAEPLRSVLIEEPLAEGLDDRVLIQFTDPAGNVLTPYDEEEIVSAPQPFYRPRTGFYNQPLIDAALYDPRALILENAQQLLPTERGYFPQFELPAYELPAYELPAYELPAYQLPAYEIPTAAYELPPSSVTYRPELAGRNTYVNRLPMKQIYLKPIKVEEPVFYLPEEARYAAAPSWPTYHSRIFGPGVEAVEQLVLPKVSVPSEGELIDASYATHIDTPASEAALVEQGDDDVSEKVANAITPEIADAAAALGLRPRRVWDRETVIDLLADSEGERDEAATD